MLGTTLRWGWLSVRQTRLGLLKTLEILQRFLVHQVCKLKRKQLSTWFQEIAISVDNYLCKYRSIFWISYAGVHCCFSCKPRACHWSGSDVFPLLVHFCFLLLFLKCCRLWCARVSAAPRLVLKRLVRLRERLNQGMLKRARKISVAKEHLTTAIPKFLLLPTDHSCIQPLEQCFQCLQLKKKLARHT